MVFLFIIFILLIGGLIGFRLGGSYYREQHYSMQEHIGHLRGYNQHWSHEARNKYTLVGQVRQEQTQNLLSVMQATIQVMKLLQQSNSLTSADQQAVEHIISTARNVTTRSEFDDEPFGE